MTAQAPRDFRQGQLIIYQGCLPPDRAQTSRSRVYVVIVVDAACTIALVTRTMHPVSFLLVVVWSRLLVARTYSSPKSQLINHLPAETDKDLLHGKAGVHYNPYNKQHPGRHVCTIQKNLTVPIQTKETFCKPVYKKYTEPCHDNQLCTGVRLVYETSYRDVITSKTTKHITYICCPGWTQVSNRSHGCNRPACSTKCHNGGSCAKPDLCTCLKGFTGRYCETDINECTEQKPCDQMCHNTYGSFKCECRENFRLDSDGQTCRKEDDGGPGLEAKDLEYGLLDKRLYKLELMFNTDVSGRNSNDEVHKLNRKVEEISKEVNYLNVKLAKMEEYKNTVAILNKKVDHLNEIYSKYESMKSYIWSNKF